MNVNLSILIPLLALLVVTITTLVGALVWAIKHAIAAGRTAVTAALKFAEAEAALQKIPRHELAIFGDLMAAAPGLIQRAAQSEDAIHEVAERIGLLESGLGLSAGSMKAVRVEAIQRKIAAEHPPAFPVHTPPPRPASRITDTPPLPPQVLPKGGRMATPPPYDSRHRCEPSGPGSDPGGKPRK